MKMNNPPLPKSVVMILSIILVSLTVYYWINQSIQNYKYPSATETVFVTTDRDEYASQDALILTVKNDLSKSIHNKDCSSFILEQKSENKIWRVVPAVSVCGWKPGFSKQPREIKRAQSADYNLVLGGPGFYRIKFIYTNNCIRSGCNNGGDGGFSYSNEFIVR